MFLASLGIAIALQGPPARVVELDATLGGKPYGKVTYTRGLVAGKGMVRTVVLNVSEEGAEYSVSETRTVANGGSPTSIVRTVTDGERKVTVTLTYDDTTANVVYDDGATSETDKIDLAEEGATIADVSQFWFFGSAPEVGLKSHFWEFSLDEGRWVEKTVTYTGVAQLKVGDATVRAHRISINRDTNFYVDEWGMPYKSVQETARGTLTLVRTSPPVGDGR